MMPGADNVTKLARLEAEYKDAIQVLEAIIEECADEEENTSLSEHLYNKVEKTIANSK